MTNRHVWNVRLGPCFCGVRPGSDGSFDLHRWQISQATSAELDVNVLVSTSEVPIHVAPEIERRVAAAQRSEWLVVAHRVCPYARREGAVLPGVALDTITHADHAIDVCASERPDQLIVALLQRAAPVAVAPLPHMAGV